MKIIEEQLLHDNYLNINQFNKKNNKVDLVYKNINDLNLFSVQESSIENDVKFFDEISFILSVITTIISKPHLITKQEETVIRSELCPNVQFDSLQRTLKDSRLWKHKGVEMLPKEIYYNQTSDEIATYENRFIVRLIDIIEQEINQYNVFYMSLIKSFNEDEDLLVDSNNESIALNKLKTLDRRIKYIKNTYFYKVVKKQLGQLGKIVPTNILLKDRLYNYCYKFYRKYITYEENSDLLKEFKQYYLYLILQNLTKLDFKLINKKNFEFKNKFFNLKINEVDLGFEFIISNLYLEDDVTTHLLVLDVNNDFSSLNNELNKKKDYLTVEAINIFKLVDINFINDTFKMVSLTKNVLKEQDLILYYLKSKLQTPRISNNVYTSICPVCKSNNILINKNDYICEECHSIYTFFNDENDNYIHIKKLRREDK